MSKPTIGKSHPANRASAELELEERNEGEELAVAQTLLSDGTRLDRIGVLSTRTSFFREKAVVCLLPLVGCARPIPVITLGLLFEPQLRFTVHIFHAFILLYVLLGYFHMHPFADMWDMEHLGHSACTTRSICRGTLHFRPHELHANPPQKNK